MPVRNAASMGSYGATWESSGYYGSGNVSELIDTLRGRVAIVAGGSDTVFEDIRNALKIVRNPVWFAANDVGMFLPKLDHWVTLHQEKLAQWKAVRWAHSKELEVAKYHSATPGPVVDYCWEGLTNTFFLSGYFAMQVAYLMGCDLIVLCGVTGDARPRFFDIYPRSDFSYGQGLTSGADRTVHEQITNEMERLPEFRAKVRSMSGATKDYFGGL